MPTPEARALRELHTPRAAALAGVIFALLFGAVVILVRTRMPEGLGNTTEWLDHERGGILTATALMPFAGISFLWFIGVIRDQFGRYEDRFFATVCLGGGLLFLAMMFVATAVAAALAASNTGAPLEGRIEVVNFGKMIVLAVSKTYALRMAAVFMMSLATIWLRTNLMPRWLVALTYLVAITLLIVSDLSMWVTLVFPAWVLVVSGFLLARPGFFEESPLKPDGPKRGDI